MADRSKAALHVVRLALSYQHAAASPSTFPPKLGLLALPLQRRATFSTAVFPTTYSPFPSYAAPYASCVASPSRSKSSSATPWGPRHAASDYEYDDPLDFLEPTVSESNSEEYVSAVQALSSSGPHTPSRLPDSVLATDPSSTLGMNIGPSQSMSTASMETLVDGAGSLAPEVVERGTTTRQCDSLARLVESGDLATARVVYYELRALRVGVIRREIYFTAATSCLDNTAEGKDAFFFWLNLIPNQPAVKPHPVIKAQWQPLVDKLIDQFTTDIPFLSEFLILSARKGTLPVVLGPVMRLLCYTTHPSYTRKFMARLMRTFMQSTSSAVSTSGRADVHLHFASRRRDDMYNSYIRALHSAGRKREAREMIETNDLKVVWSELTLDLLVRRTALATESVVSPVTSKATSQESIDPNIADLATSNAAHLELQTPTLIQQLRRARNPRLSVEPSFLRDILFQLEHFGRHSLIARLQKAFTVSPPSMEHNRRTNRGLTQFRYETWLHARLLLLRDQDARDTEIIRFFDTHFLWVGMPDTGLNWLGSKVGEATRNLIPGETVETPGHLSGEIAGASQAPISPNASTSLVFSEALPTQRKLFPSNGILSTLLPHLLPLLPAPLSTSIPRFHQAYLGLIAPVPASEQASSTSRASTFMPPFLTASTTTLPNRSFSTGNPAATSSIPMPTADLYDMEAASPMVFSSQFAVPPNSLLRPSAHAAALVRPITHHLGPLAGLDALARMVNHGIAPTLEAYAAVLYGFAGRGRWKYARRMLGCMAREEEFWRGHSIIGVVPGSLSEQGLAPGSPFVRKIDSQRMRSNAAVANGTDFMSGSASSELPNSSGNPDFDFLEDNFSDIQAPAVIRMPKPDDKTYFNTANILEQAGFEFHAEAIRKGMKIQVHDGDAECTTGTLVSQARRRFEM